MDTLPPSQAGDNAATESEEDCDSSSPPPRPTAAPALGRVCLGRVAACYACAGAGGGGAGGAGGYEAGPKGRKRACDVRIVTPLRTFRLRAVRCLARL